VTGTLLVISSESDSDWSVFTRKHIIANSHVRQQVSLGAHECGFVLVGACCLVLSRALVAALPFLDGRNVYVMSLWQEVMSYEM
jgi:hypothetical protein